MAQAQARVDTSPVTLDEDVLEAQTRMAKILLRADDSDRETVVSSGTEDSENEDGKDWIRGLAQRATEPDFKYRMAKGTFMFVKPALKAGRHFYINEEIELIQDKLAEQRLRHELKGKQFRVCGTVQYDERGRPVGFDVDQVKPAALEAAPGNTQESPKDSSSRSSSIKTRSKTPGEEPLDATAKQLPQQAFPPAAPQPAQNTAVHDASAKEVKGFAAESAEVLEAVTTAVEAAVVSAEKQDKQPVKQLSIKQVAHADEGRSTGSKDGKQEEKKDQEDRSDKTKPRDIDVVDKSNVKDRRADVVDEDSDANMDVRKRHDSRGERRPRTDRNDRVGDKASRDKDSRRADRPEGVDRESRRRRDRPEQDLKQIHERRSPHRSQHRRPPREREIHARRRDDRSPSRRHRRPRDASRERPRRRSGSRDRRDDRRHRHRDDSDRHGRDGGTRVRHARRHRGEEGRGDVNRGSSRNQQHQKDSSTHERQSKQKAAGVSDPKGSDDERPKHRVDRAARKPYKVTHKEEDGSVASPGERTPAGSGPRDRFSSVPQGLDLTDSENDSDGGGRTDQQQPGTEAARTARKDMDLRERMRQRKLQVYSTSEDDEDVIKTRRAVRAQERERENQQQSKQTTQVKTRSTSDSEDGTACEDDDDDDDDGVAKKDVSDDEDIDDRESQTSQLKARSASSSVSGSDKGRIAAVRSAEGQGKQLVAPQKPSLVLSESGDESD